MQEVQRRINNDADVRRRVEELLSLKNLLQASYPVSTEMNGPEPVEIWKFLRYGLAAGVLLVVGGFIGMSLNSINAPLQSQNAETAIARLEQKPETVKVLFHINRDDIAAFQQVLSQVESLIAEYRHSPDKLQVEIVANGTGLHLYRADNAELVAKIQKFRDSYQNVAFLGCENTYHRLSLEYGRELVLMPGITMVRLGISHVLQRQRSGWAYIQA
jgi:intracellular sulfur oxidation DsrE/DsrF family protein